MIRLKNIYKNKRSAFLVSFVLLVITIFSCKDVLDKKPLDAISDDAVFNDPVFLQGYVYDIYSGIKPPWKPGSGGYETLTDVAVDQPQTHDAAQGIREYVQGILSPFNVTDLTTVWTDEYNYIRKANIFFEKTDKGSAISPDKLKFMRGQVHFLRAWMYFELMRTYGGVPIIKNSYSLTDASFDVARNTYDECNKFVLAECDTAISQLDGYTINAGQISKPAAMALKAKILLYAASPLNNPSNDLSKWQAAEAATKAVLDLSYTLHPKRDELYVKPLQTDEIIFGKSFTPASRIPDWGYNYDYWPSGFDARQRVMPTQTFVNMFQLKNGEYPYLEDGVTVNPASGYNEQMPNENRDPRYYSTIIYPGAGPFTINDGAKSTLRRYEYWEDANPNPDNAPPYQNPNKKDPGNGFDLFDYGRDSKTYWVKGLTPFHWNVQTGYTFRKFCDFSGPRASFDYDYNQVVPYMRLAEFYLNYAEIEMALGKEDVARTYINKVRSRASVGMPDIKSSGAKLLRDYRNERAIELCLEDSRFWDLMRWKAAPGNVDIPIRGLTSVTMDWTGVPPGDINVLGKLAFKYGVIAAAEVRSKWPGDFYYLFPIPDTEIKRSHGVLKQNPGY